MKYVNNLEREIDFLQEMTLGEINFMLNFEYNLQNQKFYFCKQRYRVIEYINVHKRHEMELVVLDTETEEVGKIIMDDYHVSANPYIKNKTYINLMNSKFGGEKYGNYKNNYPHYLQSKIYRQVKDILNKKDKMTVSQILKAISIYLNVEINLDLKDDDYHGLFSFIKSKELIEYVKKSINNIPTILNEIKRNNFIKQKGINFGRKNEIKVSLVQACYASINDKMTFINKVNNSIRNDEFKKIFHSFRTGRPLQNEAETFD